MAELCLKCDVELAPGSRFCHRCGAPTAAVDKTRRQAAPATAEELAETQEVVLSASQDPTATRMAQTLLISTRPRPRGVSLRPPLWFRVLTARIWRRPLTWVALGLLAAVPAVLAIVNDRQYKAEQQAGIQRIVTRLSARCFRETREQIEARIAKVQAASGGSDSLIESAELVDIIVRGMSLPQGDCSTVFDVLARPDRFEALFRQSLAR